MNVVLNFFQKHVYNSPETLVVINEWCNYLFIHFAHFLKLRTIYIMNNYIALLT